MRYLWTYLFVLVVIIANGQQEQLFTQFMYNKLSLNPAYAGNYDHINLSAIVRNQWIGFPGAPKTQTLSINMPVANQRLGIGLNMTNSSVGISQRRTIEGAYTYRFRTGVNSILSIGLQASIRRYTLDYTHPDLRGIDPVVTDPAIPFGRLDQNIINFGGGIYFHSPQFYFGISSPRLTEADIDLSPDGTGRSREERIYYAMTGGAITINDRWEFLPQVLFKYLDHGPWDLDVNASFTYDRFLTLALNYRHGGDDTSPAESIDLIAALHLTPSLTIGVAYDFTLSQLRHSSSGSIEGLVTYTFGGEKKQAKETNPRYF